MELKKFESWIGTAGPGPGTRLHHEFLTPPCGYVLGIIVWPVFLSSLSVWAALYQVGLPSVAVTVGGLVVVGGGSLLTILSSALVLSITAWNTPYERLRRQSALLLLSPLVAVLLYGVYRTWPLFPHANEFGLSLFVAHELSKIVFVGPAIGFAFLLFPLMVFASRRLTH